MPFNTSEEIAIIDGAVQAILDLKAALQSAVQSLTPMADENLKLRETIGQLEADDAASDAALERLRNIAAPSVPPAPEPDPVAEIPAGVDPVDLPAAEPVTGEPPLDELPAEEPA